MSNINIIAVLLVTMASICVLGKLKPPTYILFYYRIRFSCLYFYKALCLLMDKNVKRKK